MASVLLLGRLMVSLAVVLGVIWLIARRARRSSGRRNTELIEVLGRSALTRSASVAVVRVGDRALVVGVAESQVSVLGETDLEAALQHRPRPGLAAPRRRRNAPPIEPEVLPARTARPSTRVAITLPADYTPAVSDTATTPDTSARSDEAATSTARRTGSLTGSALSPQTWKQTVDALRDLTTRS